MIAHRHKLENQPAFILHSYPFRETSLILEVFSRTHGRVPLVARGARRPRSALRGVLMAFQPLELSWFGKGELRTLHAAEWQGGQPQLAGTALMCGFYLNELLLNLLPRDDPHERLFDLYLNTLRQLSGNQSHAAALRSFEKYMLQELGYALPLAYEAENGSCIEPDVQYRYIVERGAVRNGDVGMPVSGKTLLDMAVDDYSDSLTIQQSKQLMRMLLNHYLAGKLLHTRELLRELQKI